MSRFSGEGQTSEPPCDRRFRVRLVYNKPASTRQEDPAVAAQSDTFLVRTDGTRLRGIPIGIEGERLVWQWAAEGGQAQSLIPVADVRHLHWNDAVDWQDAASVMQAKQRREGLWRFLTPTEARTWSEYTLRLAEDTEGNAEAIRHLLKALPESLWPQRLRLTMAAAKVEVLLMMNGSQPALSSALDRLDEWDEGQRYHAQRMYARALLASNEKDYERAVRKAVRGYLFQGLCEPQWQEACRELFIQLTKDD